jgi:hypothetical protein
MPFVKPAREGLFVPNPERAGYLAAEGEHVPRTPYWTRRLIGGDVVEATPPVDPESLAPKRGSRVSATPKED